MLRKVSILVLSLLGLVLLLSVVSHLVMAWQVKASNKNLEKIYLKDNFSVEEILADIAFYENMLQRVHPDEIAAIPLGNVKEKMGKLKDSIDDSMTRLDFYRMLAPIISQINDEHTTVLLPRHELEEYENAMGKFFPLDVVFVNGKLIVKANLSASDAIRPGMEIVSINGVPAEDLRDTLMSYFSGTRDAQKLFYLQEHFSEAFFLEYGPSASFNVGLRNPDSEDFKSYALPGVNVEREKMEPFYYDIVDNNTVIFTYNLFKNPNNNFNTFLKDMFQTIRDRNIQKLVIDLRSNKGGDTILGDRILSYIAVESYMQYYRIDVRVSQEARDAFISEAPGFVRWFPVQYFHPALKPLWAKEPGDISSVSMGAVTPEKTPLHFQGDLFVVIGPGSMSSATMLASTIKKHNMGTLVGEETGGRDTMYGNVTTYRLPKTGLEIEMPCGIVYGNTTGTVEPDYKIEQSVTDIAEKKDAVIEFIR